MMQKPEQSSTFFCVYKCVKFKLLLSCQVHCNVIQNKSIPRHRKSSSRDAFGSHIQGKTVQLYSSSQVLYQILGLGVAESLQFQFGSLCFSIKGHQAVHKSTLSIRGCCLNIGRQPPDKPCHCSSSVLLCSDDSELTFCEQLQKRPICYIHQSEAALIVVLMGYFYETHR